MKRLAFALAILALLVTSVQAAVSTTNLIHRWRFTETGAPYVDEVGAVALTVGSGTVLSVAAATSGAETGVMMGSTLLADSLGTLVGAMSSLNGDYTWTVEVIFRSKFHYTSNKSDYVNIFCIGDDPYVAGNYPQGLAIGRYGGSNRELKASIRASSGSSQQTLSFTSDTLSGGLNHAVVINNAASGTSSYWAPLSNATLGTVIGPGTARNQYNTTAMLIGDAQNNAGAIYIKEIRIYSAVLSEATLNTNHTADIAAYASVGTGNVYVAKGVTTHGYGTPNYPFDEITQATQRISNGWTINVAAGTYAPALGGLATAVGPSAVSRIKVQGVEGVPSSVVITGSGADTGPFRMNSGSWELNDLTLDAADVSKYGAYVATKTMDTLRINDCVIVNAKRVSSSGGDGIHSNAKVTQIYRTVFDDFEEHGIYLRNAGATADYAGSIISGCRISDFANYGIQMSNEGNDTYQFTGLVVANNTIIGGAASTGGGMVLYGVDGALVRNNIVDMTTSENTESGIALGVGSGSYVGALNSYVYNNRIAGANIGIYGGDCTGGYIATANHIHNNLLVNNNIEFDEGTMTLYKFSNNCGVGGTTPFPDSTGTFADSTSWRMTYGGKKGLTGMTDSAQGFQRVGISLNSPGQPVIARQQPGFRTPVESLESIRSVGALKGVTLDAYILNDQDEANLKLWQWGPHPVGHGTWQQIGNDTLRVQAAFQ